jgi:murein DD-endopeptidase MepM/ murein hydrolase activator NlpD
MNNERFRPWKHLRGLLKTQRGTGFTPDRFINGKPMTALLTGVSVVTLMCLPQNSPDALHAGVGGTGTGDFHPRQSYQNAIPNRDLSSDLIAQQEPTIASPLQGFCHPLKGSGYLSQGIRSGTHQGRTEYAYDLAVSIGSPVYAMHRGRVIAREDRYPDDGGGRGKISKFNYIWLEHEDGYRSAYLHLQQGFGRKVSLREGTWVRAGQMIGYSGNSGWSTAPHLHIEVQQPGSLDKFTKTVPFSIAENCSDGQISKRAG